MKLRRGLLDHLEEMLPSDTHLFVGLLLMAKYEDPKRGIVRANLDELSEAVGMPRSSLIRALARLQKRGFIERLKSSQNQHEKTIYRIVKYDSGGTAGGSNMAPPSDAGGTTGGSNMALATPAGGTNSTPPVVPPDLPKAIAINCLQAPKKVRRREEEKEEEEEGLDIAWEKLSAVYPHPGNLGQARISWQMLITSSESPESDVRKVLEAASIAAEIHALDPAAQRSRALPGLANFLEGGWREDRTGALEALSPEASFKKELAEYERYIAENGGTK